MADVGIRSSFLSRTAIRCYCNMFLGFRAVDNLGCKV